MSSAMNSALRDGNKMQDASCRKQDTGCDWWCRICVIVVPLRSLRSTLPALAVRSLSRFSPPGPGHRPAGLGISSGVPAAAGAGGRSYRSSAGAGMGSILALTGASALIVDCLELGTVTSRRRGSLDTPSRGDTRARRGPSILPPAPPFQFLRCYASHHFAHATRACVTGRQEPFDEAETTTCPIPRTGTTSPRGGAF
jgi:hypothetical protein